MVIPSCWKSWMAYCLNSSVYVLNRFDMMFSDSYSEPIFMSTKANSIRLD